MNAMPTSEKPDSGLDARRVALVLGWFGASARDLPWRRPECTAWGVLVSEVMLQQTPVARVLPVWAEWMQRWPTPARLAADTQADAVRAWGTLGYPRRAKRLWECARVVVERHGGLVPSEADALLALPGVGDYTASAVRAFAFGQHAVVLDTNVRRVLARVWNGEPLPPASVRAAEREVADRVAPADPATAAAWAAASMELGALVCTARSPRCDECPVVSSCAWFAGGRVGLEEAPRRTQAWHGTDRQVRGRILALLRKAERPVMVEGRADLADVEPGQVDRCLESLLLDGLVALVDADRGLCELA